MHTKTSIVDESVRHTLEYEEARELLASKIEIDHYLKEINYELNQLRRLSDVTVDVAITDIQEEMLALGRGRMQDRSRKRTLNNRPDVDVMQPSFALCLVTKHRT